MDGLRCRVVQASFPQGPEWKAEDRFGTPAWAYSGPYGASSAISLHSGRDQANWSIASVRGCVGFSAAMYVKLNIQIGSGPVWNGHGSDPTPNFDARGESDHG